MRHLVLINPAAGKSDCTAALREAAKRAFDARGLRWELQLTEYPGHAAAIAREIARTGEEAVLYVCSGDGTLGEAADGLAGSRCALAPYPIGSGNDFVKCFGAEAAAHFSSFEELIDGIVTPIDLLRVNGRVCLNIASAGLDAAVCARMPLYKRTLPISGSMAYNLSLVHCFFTAVKNRYGFEIDGEKIPAGDYIFAVAANGRFYGGGYQAAPRALLTDGLIDFIRIPSLPRLKMAGMVSSYRRGEHLEKYDCVSFRRCKSVRYLAEKPIPMNLDGEIVEMENPLVTIDPLALRLVVPKALKETLVG